MASYNTELEKYRAQIDNIDDRILDLLIERASVVKKVGELKKRNSSRKSIIRPGREAAMIRRMTSRSEGEISEAAVAQIWRLIISSAINIEENTIVSTLAMPGNRECYWLTREYFGAFTKIIMHPTISEVVQDVVDSRASIGVVQVTDDDSRNPWWVRITDVEDRPKIFARLPFVKTAPSKKTPLFAIGRVEPEATGDDESIWVIKAQENIEMTHIEAALMQAGIEYNIAEHCRVLSNPNSRNYLIVVKGFVAENDKKIKLFLSLANARHPEVAMPVSACFIGAYAVPIYFFAMNELV